MPTALCPASLIVATPALLGTPEEAPAEGLALTGEPDPTVRGGEEDFLAALRALLEWNLGRGETPAALSAPPGYGARARFAPEDLPNGLMKPVIPGPEPGASFSAEAAGEEKTTDASALEGLEEAGNGLPSLLWSAVLLGGFGTETAEEEGGSEPAPSFALPTDPEAQGVCLEGASMPTGAENPMLSTNVIGQNLVEETPIDPNTGLLRDPAGRQGVPGKDAPRVEEGKSRPVPSALPSKAPGDSAPKEGAAALSPAGDDVPFPEGAESRAPTARGNEVSATPRPFALQRGEGDSPTARAPEAAVLNACPGLTRAQGPDQEGTAAKTAPLGEVTFSEAPQLELQEVLNDADAGGESGSGREPAKGDPGFAATRSDASETLSGSHAPKRGTEAFPKALHPEVVDRIVERAVFGVRAGQREIRIDLKPEFLGQVRLHISTDHHQVMVRMVAENSVTKELIESNVHQLRAALQSQGLEIRDFDISLAHDFGRHGAEYEPRSFFGGAAAGDGEETALHIIEEESRASRIGTEQLGDTIDFFA